MTPAFDPAAFRQAFPQFASATIYPAATLTRWRAMAGASMDTTENCAFDPDTLAVAVELMTAHLGTLFVRMASGVQGGVKTSATIDKVSVAFAAPPFKDGWQYWLSQTPYGLQLWAMLSVAGTGGFYIGGAPEKRNFRRGQGFY